jgi:hypothetical protein
MVATTIKEAKKQVKDARKQGNDTVGLTDGTLEVSVGVLGTLRRRPTELAPLDDPTVNSLVASDDWKEQGCTR